jgi:hypothetical protein
MDNRNFGNKHRYAPIFIMKYLFNDYFFNDLFL